MVTGATVGELLAVFDLVGEAHERVAYTVTQRTDLVGMGVLWVDAGEEGERTRALLVHLTRPLPNQATGYEVSGRRTGLGY